MPKITAIIPNFNHGHLITDCILGLQAQTYTDFETIIIDDKSTDNSIEIIQAAIRDDKRFKLLQLPINVGVINVLNFGISASKTDFVYLGAADDITMPLMFESLIGPIERSKNAAFAVCEVRLVKNLYPLKEGSIKPAVRPSNRLHEFSAHKSLKILKSTDNWALTGASIIRRNHLVESGQLRSELGSGADGFTLRKLALTHGFVFVPKIGLVWRRNSSGYSASTLANFEVFNLQLNEYCRAVAQDPVFPIWYPAKYSKRMKFSQIVFMISNGEGGSRLRQYLLAIIAYLKYRPFPLHRIIATLISRAIEKLSR